MLPKHVTAAKAFTKALLIHGDESMHVTISLNSAKNTMHINLASLKQLLSVFLIQLSLVKLGVYYAWILDRLP